MQKTSGEDEQLLTHRLNYERALRHLAKGYVTNPLAIEANGVAIRTGLAVREATGLAKAIRDWQADHGEAPSRKPIINNSRFLVLREIYFAAGHALSMSELSEGLNFTMTYITKLVDDLVKFGWVDRVEDSGDKRKTLAKLTADGLGTIEALLPTVSRQIERNWSVLSDTEKRQLIHLLSKVLDAINQSEDTMVRPRK